MTAKKRPALTGDDRQALAKASAAVRVAKQASDQAARVLASQAKMLTEDQVEQIVQKTVTTTLAALGIVISDPKEVMEFRRDVEYMRAWRVTIQQGRSIGFKSLITVFVGGVIALMWTSFKLLTTGHP